MARVVLNRDNLSCYDELTLREQERSFGRGHWALFFSLRRVMPCERRGYVDYLYHFSDSLRDWP